MEKRFHGSKHFRRFQVKELGRGSLHQGDGSGISDFAEVSVLCLWLWGHDLSRDLCMTRQVISV